MLMILPSPNRDSAVATIDVHLVRHGAHDDVGRRLSGRAAAGGLTAEGRVQAQAAARLLGAVDRVYSSPRQRTLETASFLHCESMHAPIIAEELDEIDFGAWNGSSFDDLAHDPGWAVWNRARATARPPGGETMAAAVGRASGFIDRLLADPRHAGASIALVTHCDIVRGLLAQNLGLSFDNILRFDIDPGSVSTVRFDQGNARITRVNGTPA